MREKAAITGVGETVYSRESGRSVVSLQLEASLRAIEAAGLRPSDIDGVSPSGSAVVAEEFATTRHRQQRALPNRAPLPYTLRTGCLTTVFIFAGSTLRGLER